MNNAASKCYEIGAASQAKFAECGDYWVAAGSDILQRTMKECSRVMQAPMVRKSMPPAEGGADLSVVETGRKKAA